MDKKDKKEFTRIGFYPLWNLGADVWALNADNGTSWFDQDDKIKIDTKNKVEALEWIQDWQDYYGKDTINKLEAEFGSGVSDPFISGLVAMRAQNINYYSSLMENAPEDFDFGVIPLPRKRKRFWSLVMGRRLCTRSTLWGKRSRSLLMTLSSTFLHQKFKKNLAKRVLISWQVKQPMRT